MRTVNKTTVILIALTGSATATAVMLNRDLQLERNRADALAARVAELEPIERPVTETAPSIARIREGPSPSPNDLALERADARPASAITSQERPTRSTQTSRGSAQAREQVARLQAALVDETPLQEYQVRALIAAIDAVRSNSDREGSAQVHDGAVAIDRKAETNEPLIQAAADILFESQLERFIEIVKSESHAGR